MASTLDTLRARLNGYKGRLPSLAKEAGVPLSTIRKIVYQSVTNPRIETVEKLSRALDRQGRRA